LRVTLSINHHHDFARRFQDASFRVEGTEGAAMVKLGLLLDYPVGEPDELWIVRRGGDWQQVPLQGRWFPDAFLGPMCNLQRFASGEDSHLATCRRCLADHGTGRGLLCRRARAAFPIPHN
jgi:hypothetical protein